MGNKKTISTSRLIIDQLSVDDSLFIFELVNTQGWLTFIGDKEIRSTDDAASYIKKINATQSTIYWTVRLKTSNSPIGIVTFIKRDHLPHHDIGFAFLPAFYGKGYAFEATTAVLTHLARNKLFTTILAITLPHNTSSIKLLQKLGLEYSMEIKNENKSLHIYEASAEKLSTSNL